jgi:hypothetical protein
MSDNSKLIVSALLKTDEALSQKIDGPNSWAQAVAKRGARVKLYRQYDEGEHRSVLTDQMRNLLHLKVGPDKITEFNDNYCGIVLDKMAGRVTVSEISTGEDTIDQKWLEPMLEKQDFQATEGKVWRGAICDGDSYVMVDLKTLLWSIEPAFDGFSGMVAVYNQITRKPIWACKVWAESDPKDQDKNGGGSNKTMHLVVYQPNKISFWQGQDGGGEVTERKQEDGELSKVWPPEMEGVLPFVSFANDRNNYTQYGNSEIRKAIPLQDVLNRTLHSMVMASEFAAFKVAWSIGMELNPGGIVPGGILNLLLKDKEGNLITDFSDNQLAFIQACKVGQLEATDLSQYTNQIATIVKEISQATQTPIYGITAEGVLSGDALKQLEIGLIGKVKRFQRQNTDSLRELIMLTAKMERVFNPGLGTPEITKVDITWASPELLDKDAQIKSLTAMRKDADGLFADDFYRMKIGKLLGMSKQDIDNEANKAEEEKQKKLDDMAKLQPPSIFGQNIQENNPLAGNQGSVNNQSKIDATEKTGVNVPANNQGMKKGSQK